MSTSAREEGMQTNRSTTDAKPNGQGNLKLDPSCELLDLLTSVRSVLRNGVREKPAYCEQLASSIARVFDAMDASIGDLKAIVQERALPS